MSNCAESVSQQAAEINALNFKALYDDTQSDVSINRKSLMRHQDAWETLRLRNAQFAASFDHALLAAVAVGTQTGNTMDQAPVGPIRTAAGDATIQMPPGAAYPPNRQSDQMGAVASGAVDTAASTVATAAAGVATANQAIADALATAIAMFNQGLAALQSVAVTAAGGASTPSQTQAK